MPKSGRIPGYYALGNPSTCADATMMGAFDVGSSASGYINRTYHKAAERNEYPNFGLWYPPEGVRPIPGLRVGEAAVPTIMAADEAKDTILWPYLFKFFPTWRHGSQGTGDCVSWGWKHMLDVQMCVQMLLKRSPEEWVAALRQETIYGFGRVEIFGRPDRGGPGMYGGGAFKAVKRYGTLHELKYPTYDLRRYSGSRAISWGRTGVPDALENKAAEHKVKDGVVVTSCRMAGALIQQGYAVTYCGGSYWGRTRNSQGVATRFSSGAHCMTMTGVRYDGRSEPKYLWVANTGHGNHVSGPVGPFEMPSQYDQCGSWVPVNKIERVLNSGDSHSVSLYEGFKTRKLPDIGSHIFG